MDSISRFQNPHHNKEESTAQNTNNIVLVHAKRKIINIISLIKIIIIINADYSFICSISSYY